MTDRSFLKLEYSDDVCFRIVPAAAFRSRGEVGKVFAYEGDSGRILIKIGRDDHILEEVCCYSRYRWGIADYSVIRDRGIEEGASVCEDALPRVFPGDEQAYTVILVFDPQRLSYSMEIIFSGEEKTAICFRTGRFEVYTGEGGRLRAIRVSDLTPEEKAHLDEENRTSHDFALLARRMAKDDEFDEDMLLKYYVGGEKAFIDKVSKGKRVIPSLLLGGFYYFYRGMYKEGSIIVAIQTIWFTLCTYGLAMPGIVMPQHAGTLEAASAYGWMPGEALIMLIAFLRFPKSYMLKFRRDIMKAKDETAFPMNLIGMGVGNPVALWLSFFASSFLFTVLVFASALFD